MAKSKGPIKIGGNFSHADHESRRAAKIKKLQAKLEKKRKLDEESSTSTSFPDDPNASQIQSGFSVIDGTYKRTKFSHDTEEKVLQARSKLSSVNFQRQVKGLRSKLSSYDHLEAAKEEKEKEAKQIKKDETKGMTVAEAVAFKKAKSKEKRLNRFDPAKWKLKGAARPAVEIYDFDVNYVDPYMKEMEDHDAKNGRLRNVFSESCGSLGNFGMVENMGVDSTSPQPICRDFLDALFVLGCVEYDNKRYKSARAAWKEGMELDMGMRDETMCCRFRLLRMYLECNKPESARRLLEKFPDDQSCWFRMAEVLIEYVSFALLEEEGSSEAACRESLKKAIRGNPFAVLYMAFHSHFEDNMEFCDTVEDYGGEGGVLEAVEYCNDQETVAVWMETEGAMDWLNGVVVEMMNENENEGEENGEKIKLANWEKMLAAYEKEQQEAEDEKEKEEEEEGEDEGEGEGEGENEGDDEDEDEDEDEEEDPRGSVDGKMFAEMFRTSMEMMIEEASEDAPDLEPSPEPESSPAKKPSL